MTAEWLTRDPLNGLVVTLFFFVSLTVGRYIRKIRDRGTVFSFGPETRVLAAFLLVTGMTLMEHWYLPAVIFALCIMIALRTGRIKDYARKLIFPLLLAAFILAVQAYSGNTDYGYLVFSRVAASASVLVLLITTTSVADVLFGMRRLGLPATMIDISSFMRRYISTFSYDGKKLLRAQQARGGLSQKRYHERIRNIASVCGLLVMRAFARGDEVYRAMISRGWRPGMKNFVPPPNLRDAVPGILFFLIISGFVILDRVI